MSFDFAQDFKQKGFAPILVVILVAVLAIGGYFVYTSLRGVSETSDVAISPTIQTPTPSQDPTANWKTYTSKYGYSFQYPSDWEMVATQYLSEDDEVLISYNNPKDVPLELQVGTKIPKDIPKNVSLESWIKTNFPPSPDLPRSEKDIIVGNINAKEFTSKYEGVNKRVLIPYNSKVYQLHFATLFGELGVNEEKIYNQILSTFKFTQ